MPLRVNYKNVPKQYLKTWQQSSHSGSNLSIFEFELQQRLINEYASIMGKFKGGEEYANKHIKLIREKGLTGSAAERAELRANLRFEEANA